VTSRSTPRCRSARCTRRCCRRRFVLAAAVGREAVRAAAGITGCRWHSPASGSPVRTTAPIDSGVEFRGQPRRPPVQLAVTERPERGSPVAEVARAGKQVGKKCAGALPLSTGPDLAEVASESVVGNRLRRLRLVDVDPQPIGIGETRPPARPARRHRVRAVVRVAERGTESADGEKSSSRKNPMPASVLPTAASSGCRDPVPCQPPCRHRSPAGS